MAASAVAVSSVYVSFWGGISHLLYRAPIAKNRCPTSQIHALFQPSPPTNVFEIVIHRPQGSSTGNINPRAAIDSPKPGAKRGSGVTLV
jgi:hypothetical protein